MSLLRKDFFATKPQIHQVSPKGKQKMFNILVHLGDLVAFLILLAFRSGLKDHLRMSLPPLASQCETCNFVANY